MEGRQTGSSQRVRIGLTGLAFVFVAVLLAAVFTSEPLGEPTITPNSIEQQRNGQDGVPPAPAEAEPTEPLAELGVAPGNAEQNAQARPAAAPAPVATR